MLTFFLKLSWRLFFLNIFFITEQAHWSISRRNHLAPPTVLRWRRCVLLKWKWRRYQVYLLTHPFPLQPSSTPSSRRANSSPPQALLPVTRSVWVWPAWTSEFYQQMHIRLGQTKLLLLCSVWVHSLPLMSNTILIVPFLIVILKWLQKGWFIQKRKFCHH